MESSQRNIDGVSLLPSTGRCECIIQFLFQIRCNNIVSNSGKLSAIVNERSLATNEDFSIRTDL